MKKALLLFVSPDGNDSAAGTAGAPFATIGAARDAIRKLNKNDYSAITVTVRDGEYHLSGLTFTAEDSGTETCPISYRAEHPQNAVLNGGVKLNPADFAPVTDPAVAARLTKDAREHVRVFDLGKIGVTAADYGKIYTIGSYITAGKYDGDWVGPQYAELFCNDQRMNLARYPNEGWLKTGNVLEEGDGCQSPKFWGVREGWYDRRNHAPDLYELDEDLASRIHGWATLDDVWMFGYWCYDWADASTPIGCFDYEKKQFSPKFVSFFGVKEGAPYYFFNVLEELDVPGEWYLDRKNGLLYLWADADFDSAEILLSLTQDPILTVDGADRLTFEGLTFKGTRGDAVVMTGDRNTVKKCLIKCVGGSALRMTGYENLASRNEITRTGKGGIFLSGGDRETLTPGSNIAENNLIHDWSEVFLTYQPGVKLDGVGNICRHNEMFNSPHEAIAFSGNSHLIEYNFIHEAVLLSMDAGAIYAGRHWDWYGTVIRYNYIRHLGSGTYTPNGIYLDDTLSGITVYGNLLVDIPGDAIVPGGGRDYDVRNNIIAASGRMNCPNRPIIYDDRMIAGLNGGWFGDVRTNHNGLWDGLEKSPRQTDIWKKAYPQMARIKLDPDATDDPDFPGWPAYSTVTGNLLYCQNDCVIAESVYRYSTVADNPKYLPAETDAKSLFVDPDAGNYHLIPGCDVYKKLPDFEDLPIEEMGIQPETPDNVGA